MNSRAVLVATLLLVPSIGFPGEFTQSLSPENLRASGLSKLSPQELATLESLIENYQAAKTSQPKPAMEPAAPAASKPPRHNRLVPEWVGALITLKRAENNTAASQALETTIIGQFSGWTGRTQFTLENGQVWTQVNNDTYRYTPPLTNPKVRIFPATFGSFWLEVDGVGQRCRVRPLRLE